MMAQTIEDPVLSMARRTLYGLREKDIEARREGMRMAFCHFCGKKIIRKGAHWMDINYMRRWVCVDCFEIETLDGEE